MKALVVGGIGPTPFDVPEEIAHPYAHPKEAGNAGDHRNR
jgi:hypothetical protein